MNFVKLYIGDYMRDTGTLSVAEHGAYMLMLLHHYATEAPLPKGQELYRLVRAVSKAEREAVDAVVGKFWTDNGQGLVNNRAGQEIERAAHQRAVNQEVGKRGGRRKRTESETESVSEPEPIKNPNHSQTPEGIQASSNELASAFQRPPRLAVVEKKGPPDCPHRAVLELWKEVLPALPQHNPELWKGSRADHLRVRWRETAMAKGWVAEADGLAYFRRLFSYIGQSAFLTGRGKSSDGRPPFQAELAWLVKAENWAKTIEGKYHQEAA